jgi:hypothetical protein
MSKCFICLGKNNLIKICKCNNLFTHKKCGSKLRNNIIKCDVCKYRYQYEKILLSKIQIFFIYLKDIFDISLGIFLGSLYIYYLNKINLNIFINTILHIYISLITTLYILITIIYLVYKYSKNISYKSAFIQSIVKLIEPQFPFIINFELIFYSFKTSISTKFSNYYKYSFSTILLYITFKITWNLIYYSKEIINCNFLQIIKNDIKEKTTEYVVLPF